MPYHKFRLHKQFERFNTRRFKRRYEKKLQEKMPEFLIPEFLQTRGIPLEDPNSPDFPSQNEAPAPVKITHPAFYVPKPEEHHNFKHTPCHLFDGSEVLSEGVDQALVLSKSVKREGLPRALMDRVNNIHFPMDHHNLLKRHILQANKWDSAMDPLSRRHDPVLFWIKHPREYGIPDWRKNEILLDNLYRYCMVFKHTFPWLMDLRLFRYGAFNATVTRNTEETLCFRHTSLSTVLRQEPLKAFLPHSQVQSTVDEPLVDVHPIKPTIDLPEEHIYDHKPQYPFSWKPIYGGGYHVHTVLCSREEDSLIAQKYPWAANEKLGCAILKCFGSALAIARNKYGMGEGEVLRDPVVVQLIQLCHGCFDFVVFQLNTMDFSTEQGVKNVAWVDGNNRYFLPKMFYEDFDEVEELNPEVFTKFLALILNK